MPNQPPSRPSVVDLTPAEKLQLVQDLWDDLAANPEDVPIPEWQKEEVVRRKARLMSAPASGLDWEDVKRVMPVADSIARIRQQLWLA